MKKVVPRDVIIHGSDEYWEAVRRRAEKLGSDGCTFATELYHDCCLEHDCMCRDGVDLYGDPVSRWQAAWRFMRCCQSKSPLGKYSPVSYWRYVAVMVREVYVKVMDRFKS